MEKKPKILIVEDDTDSMLGLSVILQKEGYLTVFAQDGATALEKAKTEFPDLMILDLGLPSGDGHFVLFTLKKLKRNETVPVIVLSARPAEFNEQHVRNMGAVAYFEKPADIPRLLDVIRTEIDAISEMGAALSS